MIFGLRRNRVGRPLSNVHVPARIRDRTKTPSACVLVSETALPFYSQAIDEQASRIVCLCLQRGKKESGFTFFVNDMNKKCWPKRRCFADSRFDGVSVSARAHLKSRNSWVHVKSISATINVFKVAGHRLRKPFESNDRRMTTYINSCVLAIRTVRIYNACFIMIFDVVVFRLNG